MNDANDCILASWSNQPSGLQGSRILVSFALLASRKWLLVPGGRAVESHAECNKDHRGRERDSRREEQMEQDLGKRGRDRDRKDRKRRKASKGKNQREKRSVYRLRIEIHYNIVIYCNKSGMNTHGPTRSSTGKLELIICFFHIPR